MLATLSGIVMLFKPLQPENASSPMLVTLSPTVILAKPLHLKNALYPILVTLFGMIMLVKPLQSENVSAPMLVTLPSLGIMLFLQPAIRVLLAVSIRQLPSLWYTELPGSTVILVNPLQLENAPFPMCVTLSGIVMLVKPLQPENAPLFNPVRTPYKIAA